MGIRLDPLRERLIKISGLEPVNSDAPVSTGMRCI